jgi:hypothetical protein
LGSDDLEEEESSNLLFGLEHLLPPRLPEENSPTQFNLEHLLPSRVQLDQLRTPTKASGATDSTPRSLGGDTELAPSDSTAKWVQQFLADRLNNLDNEAGNWWSDSSPESDREKESVDDSHPSPESVKPKRKGHKARQNNLTLKQEDFWAHFSQGQREELVKMMKSRYADPEYAGAAPARNPSGSIMKSRHALETVPVQETSKPELKEEKKPEPPKQEQPKQEPSQPVVENTSQPSVAPQPAPVPRQRKRVPWKGKSCWVSIPKDIPRGTPGYPPKPMTSAEVEQRIEQFQKAGYDTRGFEHSGNAPVDGSLAQNRAIWPAEADVREERNHQFRVYIPNRSQWEAYVNFLTEQKLAALGVSLGGGEEEDSPMSRQTSTSQHPGMPFSPPLPTSSAGSHRIRQGSVVSGPGFPFGPSPGHASRQSIASPISPFGNPRASMHMHRHSTFSPASFIHQQSASPSGAWSPGQYFGTQDPRGGSPALPPLPISRPDLADVPSPSSPFGIRPNQQFPISQSQKDELLALQQQQLQTQLLQQQQQQQQLLGIRPSSTLAEVPEDEAEEDEIPEMRHAAKPGPDIAVPTPRGHRHNISANLEREARDAEYHLEEAIDKQFDEGGDFSTEPEITDVVKPSNPVTDSKWEKPQPILHQPQPHNRAHSLTKPQQTPVLGYSSQQTDVQQEELSDGARTNVSELTNPSLENGKVPDTAKISPQHSKTASQVSTSWKDPKAAFGKPGSTRHSKNTSMSSTTKLNVEAKEFKFNPAATFSPTSFSSGFSFVPATSKPVGQDAAPWSNRSSIGSLGSGLNVSAPAFKPDAPVFKPAVEAPVFKPAAMNSSAMPSSSFDFGSSKGPSFKPDAPAFNPSIAAFNTSLPVSPPTTFSSKIFGNVNLSASDIIKPAKRSKAIPIVPPSAVREKTPEKVIEVEDKEDESGRPMQADGREKRARRGRSDGDEVPKFAVAPILPTHPLTETKHFQAAKQNPQAERKAVPEDKENLSPNAERATIKSKSPEPLVTSGLGDGSSFGPGIPTPKTDGSMSDSKTPIDDDTPRESEAVTPLAEEPSDPVSRKKHSSKSSLSATAKPFEFRPQFGTSGFDFGIHVTKPSAARSEDLDNSHISPPRHANQSPATTFRPSDDGSYKTALESRRHVPYTESESVDFERFAQPSFNEIDAVMKHMNEEGSDFGVERDEPNWNQSSPRRPAHDFDRHDLPPNLQLRSDAPSPSPRRINYVQQNLHASSTSITHDPFSDERAGLAYESPIHRLNNPDDVPISDWDEGITSEGEDKIQTRSRFFDSHVNELIGRVIQNRLDPLERNLQDIHDSIALISQRSGRGRRSMSTNDRESDADDEDEEIGTDAHYRNRSPRKDRKLEKMRSIIKETLETHQPAISSLPVPVPDPVLPERIREVVIDALSTHQSQPSAAPVVEPMRPENVRDIIMEALAHHQPQWTPPKSEPVLVDQIRSIVEEVISSHQPPVAPAPAHDAVGPDEIRSIVTEALASHKLPVPEPVSDIKSIVMEALASHQSQLPAAPAVEPVQPETIRSIVTEALEAQQDQFVPVVEPVQPEHIRSIIADALESHKAALATERENTQPPLDISEFYQIVGSMKATVAQAVSGHVQPEDIREMVQEALARHSAEIAQQRESQVVQEKDRRIAELEALLKETTLRLDDEISARQSLEVREEKTARLLKVTEEELSLLREAAKDDENKARALEVQCEDARREIAAQRSHVEELRSKIGDLSAENDKLNLNMVELESAEMDAIKKLSAAAAENEALQFTLKEYRISSDKWRDEIQQANQEKERMRHAIDTSRVQAEEATRVREAMRVKLEKLQQDMMVAVGQAAAERAQWQKSDETHMKKYEVLSARIEAEGRTRERLERELERLEAQEREGMKLRVSLEQTQKANGRLEEIINELRHESMEHQKNAERFEREFKEAREAGRVEIRRTRVLMEADIDAANNQVNIVRADLESEISRLRTELDNVRLDADTTKAKHELDLEAASDAKKQAVDEAMASMNRALLEQQQTFERRIELLSKEHQRALELARDDKERAESYHKKELSLAKLELGHLHDKIALMDEKLAIAKEAASAAVQAAHNAKGPATKQTSNQPSGLEKISPQALRESIAVLQEQLQERESRIESLEQKLSELDTDAPAKLKERETEIGWLRELLGVRIDDLNDLIKALAQPAFDRDAVRDAAIRIRTSLQMEQHEKERLMTGGQTFPTLATLSNFASPKAVQIAAAFGNWRKGRENASSSLAGGSNGSSRSQTPSRTKPATAQSFLSGLMTPPTSNLRRTPDLSSSGNRPPVSRSNSSTSSTFQGSTAGFPSLGKQPVPSTPPLLRTAAYDQDAEDGRFSESGFYDDESTVDGDVTPIGLNFGQELRR